YLDVFLTRFAPRVERALFPWQDESVAPLDWSTLSCTQKPEAARYFEKTTGRYLVELAQMSRSAGASFGVLVTHYLYSFPDDPFYEPRFPFMRESLVKNRCYEENALPYVRLVDGFLERNGIAYRDTHAAFLAAKREAPTRKLWNFFDYHFSPR